MTRLILSFALAQFAASLVFAQGNTPPILQKPTISRTQIAFAYGGDLWLVAREGGDARRLTTGVGIETDPIFSPDGSMIAFTGEYEGNIDVYVVPAAGGVPKRLTYHPGADEVVGWTNDGKRVLFRSSRSNYTSLPRLFTMAIDGTFPEEIPLPIAERGSFSPDGSHIAYQPTPQWQPGWKNYKGGQTSPIWIARLSDSSVEEIPRKNSNDKYPVWLGDKIYFLSDRSGPVTPF